MTRYKVIRLSTYRITDMITDMIVTLAFLSMTLLYFSVAHREVTLSQGMAGYGLPACVSEDDAPVGGCVWHPGDGPVWINYPGRV